MITNDIRSTCEIKFRIAKAKAAFKNDNSLSASKVDLNLRNEVPKCCILSVALHGPESWTIRKVDQKYLESFEMFWRRTEVIILSDRVKKNEVFHRVKEERNILHT
jgi:hypothetical protein